jgi:hypothetical protein
VNLIAGVVQFPVPWYEEYKWNGVWMGRWAVAPSSLSFHFVTAGEMQALDFMLNMLNKRCALSGDVDLLRIDSFSVFRL